MDKNKLLQKLNSYSTNTLMETLEIEFVAVGEDYIDQKKIRHAIDVANISDYIDALPLGINTKIGSEGSGLSTGQKQRLFIARSVYKNPKFLFFDDDFNASVALSVVTPFTEIAISRKGFWRRGFDATG